MNHPHTISEPGPNLTRRGSYRSLFTEIVFSSRSRVQLAAIILTMCHISTEEIQAALIDSADAQYISFPDARFTVNGLAWFLEDTPALRRLPIRLKDTFRAPVWDLAQQPSGGRIRFKTDSTRIAIRAQNPDTSGMHHMTTIGQCGFDIYVDNEYRGSAWPDKSGNIIKEWRIAKSATLRDITLYLPLYKGVTISEIVLESNARIEPPAAFAIKKPIVFYGSSITQGGCASNPGMSYQAQVARWLNVDFVNLGFSGNGMGEPALADVVSEIDAACFVLDYWGNPTPQVYKESLPNFVATLRKKYPKTPILITGPYFIATQNDGLAEDAIINKRNTAREFVQARRRTGDKNISYVDGHEMLSREHAYGLVDGVHCNSLGFYFCAKGLEPHLRKAIKVGLRN
jgi:lysophospholipase L1-like esterase